MSRVNIPRLLLATLAVAVFYFIADGVIHGVFLGQDHKKAYELTGKLLVEDPANYAFFALFDLGKAFIAMFFYAVARPRFGAGVKTAVIAGLVAWLGVETLPAIAAMPFPFYPKVFYCKLIALELLPMIVGGILGGWIYRD